MILHDIRTIGTASAGAPRTHTECDTAPHEISIVAAKMVERQSVEV